MDNELQFFFCVGSFLAPEQLNTANFHVQEQHIIVCLRRKKTLLPVVSDLPGSGCLKVCKDAQFLTSDLDHRTGLALLAILGCQCSSGVVPNGPASSHSGSSNICQSLNCQHACLLSIRGRGLKPRAVYNPSAFYGIHLFLLFGLDNYKHS